MQKTKYRAIFAIILSIFLGHSAWAAEALRQVENKEVCMVNNIHFGRLQIPVPHAGKTYYGCCEMCKTTLATDQSARIAKDPVTKASVDKARAVIGAMKDGSVLYFESQETFNRYQKQAQKQKPST